MSFRIPTADKPMVAVEQHGYCIFGVGENAAAAKADAKEWLNPGTDLSGIDFVARPYSGQTRLAECTPALAAAIREHGGDIAYGETEDGTLCLPDEAVK